MLVTGANGVGKTNLLESLHVGTQGFSPRTRSEGQLVRFGCDAARVELAGRRRESALEIRLDISRTQGKRARLNGAQLGAAERLRREVHTLVFTPDRLAIVKSGPAARRAYFDRVLARLVPARAQLPAEYAAAVGQRNAALRRVAAGVSSREALAPWTEQVCALGQELVAARGEITGRLSGPFAVLAGSLGLADATLAYEGEPPTQPELEALLDRDLERGTTGVGPHLHDVAIRSGPLDVRTFGSQGEQRIAVLGLLLAEAQLLGTVPAAPPLLLLDDVLSELDVERRAMLVRLLPESQTVITATARELLDAEPAQVLRVTPGHVASS